MTMKLWVESFRALGVLDGQRSGTFLRAAFSPEVSFAAGAGIVQTAKRAKIDKAAIAEWNGLRSGVESGCSDLPAKLAIV